MKRIFYGCLAFLLFVPDIIFSQQSTEKYSFFHTALKSVKQDYAKDVKDGVILQFDKDQAASFLQKAPHSFEMDLPISLDGEKLTLKLGKADVFTEDFKIVSNRNPDKGLDINLGLHYHGVVKGNENALVAISIHDNYISGVIATPRGNYNLGKLDDSENEHIVYSDRDLLHTHHFKCGVEDDDYVYPREILEDHSSSRDAGDCVRIYVEVDHDIVINKGGDVDAAGQFATDLFNQVFILFAAESINLVVSEMLVWEDNDPYPGTSSTAYLSQFQANISEIEGDLGHLLAITGGGGAAIRDGLCRTNIDSRLAISNVENSNVVNVPTYSWNVNVVAHELGHQLGSRHTHDCAWNGNGTQIDDCGNVSAGSGGGCFDPLNPVLPANEGTIMSYCHLDDDIGVELIFNGQVSNVMRDRVANADCLNDDCGSCDLVLDCSDVPWQFITCPDEVDDPNVNLIDVESACAWPVDITFTESGTATPGDPFIRTYTATDPTGETATCVQGFSGSGSTAAVTGAYPNECVLDKLKLTGNYIVCSPMTLTSLRIEFWQTGVATGVSYEIDVNPDGTWEFEVSGGTMVDDGLERGVWYDIYPFLTLSNGDIILGDEFEFGLNNDVFIAEQSDPQVILNTEEDDLTTSQLTFCYGSPIYYHGTDPLSANHFVSITRHKIGFPGGFTDYRKFGTTGWTGVSLDGFTADLQDYFQPNPQEYFLPGYEYRLQVASSNTAECVTWSPTYVEFKVVDCCAPDWELVDVPECVVDGAVNSLSIILDAPIDPALIGFIYSDNNNYSIVDYEIIDQQNTLELIIYFVSNQCTCEGAPFVFDIELEGCNYTVWAMTDYIPCCDTDCGFFNVTDWSAEECIIINGNPAREFCIEVSSDIAITDVFPGTNEASCQVELLDLEVTPTGVDGMYEACGYMVFQDFECVGFGIVTLVFETEAGCCTVTQGFSFPEGCQLGEACAGGDPEIQLVFDDYMTVSLNIPQGEIVTITDHTNGNVINTQVGGILCQPFWIDPSGNIGGGVDCNGISVPIPLSLDCNGEDGEIVELSYHFEITWGNCTWILLGDYCDGLIIVSSSPDRDRVRESENQLDGVSTRIETSDGSFKIFPNPLANSKALNFDGSGLNQNIQSIEVKDLQGRNMETIIPEKNQRVFSHNFAQPLPPGVYFVVVRLEDGSLSTAKLVTLKE